MNTLRKVLFALVFITISQHILSSEHEKSLKKLVEFPLTEVFKRPDWYTEITGILYGNIRLHCIRENVFEFHVYDHNLNNPTPLYHAVWSQQQLLQKAASLGVVSEQRNNFKRFIGLLIINRAIAQNRLIMSI